jgi:hypothetical protein
MLEEKDTAAGENIRRGLRKNKVQATATRPSINLEEFELFREGIVIKPNLLTHDEEFE